MSLFMLRANLAVMSILRSEHLPAQGRLDLCVLRAQWPRYALRGRDLDRSIERLESIGFVEVDHARGHDYVVLTDMGYRSAHSVLGWFESLMTWPRRVLGAWSRYTHPRPASDAPRRRQMDRSKSEAPRLS